MAATKDIAWSQNTYSLHNFLEKFKGQLPVIILVTRGYYGQDDIETLASDQVARIHTFATQKRVLARDARGRYLSIPADYPIKFEVIEKKGKRTKVRFLREILQTYSLPVTVVFERKPWNFRIGSQKYTNSNFGRIEMQHIYLETFLKGNTIHEGVIDDKVMLVPTYVNIHVKVAQGLRHGTKEEWLALKTMYARAVSHVRFDKINGTRDIMLYPWVKSGDNDKLLAVGLGGGPGVKSALKGGRDGMVGGQVGGGKGGNNHQKPKGDMLDDGSGMLKLPPNWTLVLNINKDDLSLQRSLSPASGAMVPSSVIGSLDNHLDGLDGYSDTSSLSGDSIDGSITTVQNVVRVSLCDAESLRYRNIRHRPDSRSSRTTSLSTLKKSRKTQTPGDPRADIYSSRRPRSAGPGDGVGDGMRRAASLESLQDVKFSGNVTKATSYHDDMDIVVPVRMDGMDSLPRRRYESMRRQSSKKGGVARYGSRSRHATHDGGSYGSLRPGSLSHSAHDLRQTEVQHIPYSHMPRHHSLERIAYDDEDYDVDDDDDEGLDDLDTGQVGVRNIYQTDELWMGLSDNQIPGKGTYTMPYTRRAGLDRATKAANNVMMTSPSTFPRTRSNDFRYVPTERDTSYLSSLPHGQLRMSISNLRNRRPLVITRTAAPRVQTTAPRLQSSSNQNIFYQPSPSTRYPPPAYRSLYTQPTNYMSYSGLSTSSYGTSNYKTTDDLRPSTITNNVGNGVSVQTTSSLSPPSGDRMYSGTMTLRPDQEGPGGMESIRSSTYPVSPLESESSPTLHSPLQQGSGVPFSNLGDFTTFNGGPQITSLTVQNVPVEMDNSFEEPFPETLDEPPPPLISVTDQDNVISDTVISSFKGEAVEEPDPRMNNLAPDVIVNGDNAIYATVNKVKISERKEEETKAIDSDASSNQAEPPLPPPPSNKESLTTNHVSTTNNITTPNHVTSKVTSVSSASTSSKMSSSSSKMSSEGGKTESNLDSTDSGKGSFERNGSVRSLRDVYRQLGKTPPSSVRMKGGLSVAPASEIFSNAANETTQTKGTSKIMVNGGDDMGWQETSSYPMDSINDSLKELDAVLKQADPDTQSQSSHTSSKMMDNFNFALSGEEATKL